MKFLPICLFLILFSTKINAQQKVSEYIHQAIDTMRKYSIYSDSVNWGQLVKDANDSILVNKYPTIEQSYTFLKSIINQRLGDQHGFILPQYIYDSLIHGSNQDPYAPIQGKFLQNNIGYIQLPAFISFNTQDWIRFVNDFYDKLQQIDQYPLKYWLIDLRGNSGGTFDPMFMAMYPLFKNTKDLLGYIDNKGDIKYYNVKNRILYIGDTPSILPDLEDKYVKYPSIPHLKHKNLPIFVLVDNGVASSGEYIAAIFNTQSNATLIGTPTAGLTTGNDIYKLSNKDVLILSSCYIIDHNKVPYKNWKPIDPSIKSNASKLDDFIDIIETKLK